MLKLDTIQKKILFVISSFAIVVIFGRTVLFASSSYQEVKDDLQQQIVTQLERDSLKLTSYFMQYARVVDTFINAPEVIDWMLNHKERGAFTAADKQYDSLNRVFHTISDRDENILSAFYASEATQEYMAEGRITGVPDEGHEFDEEKGYFVRKRPWYNHAVDFKDMLTTPPAVDAITGAISVSLEQAVYVNNKLLGVGGIDISLNNINKLSSEINFKGQGFAALFDDKWQNITFPNTIIKKDINTPIEKYDELQGTIGLSSLSTADPLKMTEVTINETNYYAVTMPVTTQMPKMTWHLALFIPIEVIENPARKAVTNEIIISIVILVITLTILTIITSIVSRPLRRLTDAFASVAEGDSDLTLVIDENSSDETGKLANYFNIFLAKLREVISGVALDKEGVSTASAKVEYVSQQLIEKTNVNKQALSTASVAATQLAASAGEIENNAMKTSNASTDMRDKTDETISLAKEAVTNMQLLGDKIEAVNTIMKDLDSASANIGQVVDVINSIADQTNLLALNAAIEAARAGEHGRGFSVVADEVRGLAQRTQESTKEIYTVVDDLQRKITQAGTGMSEGIEQTKKVSMNIATSGESMEEIGSLLDTIQDDMGQVATACVQQTKAINEISETMSEVNDFSEESTLLIQDLGVQAVELKNAVNGLERQLNKFTY
ncbi:methyl-accepting chemotaxis protein [Thalassotalea piscium]|uniref:Methyl-accepting chemotaxis protein n=1 Tax=Thalassotalea piscium TaxID=1230533 RepID=A0A7X0NKB5_9GAMM|nr:methyl-accepting chemotaxis protein [Thalassotalea piscium]MBB6544881.1 methyl-accepting chemotaxis protein [Thalassotalea piscium]